MRYFLGAHHLVEDMIGTVNRCDDTGGKGHNGNMTREPSVFAMGTGRKNIGSWFWGESWMPFGVA